MSMLENDLSLDVNPYTLFFRRSSCSIKTDPQLHIKQDAFLTWKSVITQLLVQQKLLQDACEEIADIFTIYLELETFRKKVSHCTSLLNWNISKL